jgi:Alpha-L-arabinofuranosidase B (ABFB) domain
MPTTELFTDTTSFRSVNFLDRFIRHKNFLGEIEPVSSALDKLDASFITRGGLAVSGDGAVSYESVNFKNHYLRHQGFRLKLHPLPPPGSPDRNLFERDATFFIVEGNASNIHSAPPTGAIRSFRSFNFNTRFLRHRDFHIFLDELNLANDLDRMDSTFVIQDGFAPIQR